MTPAPPARPSPLLTATALLALTTLWTCPFAALLGIPCPGCGLTRAAWALLQGEWARALALHPLSPVVVPLAAVAGVFVCLRGVGAPPPAAYSRLQSVLLWSLCILLFGVWLARFAGALGGPVPVQSVFER